MKKIRLSVLIIAAWMILPMTLWAMEVTRNVVSDTNTDSDTSTEVCFVDGLGVNTYDVEPTDELPPGWNSDPDFDGGDLEWRTASLITPENRPVEWLNPLDTSPFVQTKAKWISINLDGMGPDATQIDGIRGVYLYRKTFKVSPMAYNVSGEVAIASDNYGWLYLNGDEVLQPGDLSEHDWNFESPSTKFILPKLWACDNVLAAEVQNGCGDCGGSSIIPNGPTGVIFSLTLDYELPDVVWEPPVSNLESSGRKNGSTLPLKFRLYGQNGKLMKQPQQVYLAVHEGSYTDTNEDGLPDLGETVIEWNLGNSVRNMRFSKGNGQYIANFQTQKEENLDDGWYTAVVHDVCSDEMLGYIEFNLVGKKKEKDPKPPKPKK